jgi:hypothetical protein
MKSLCVLVLGSLSFPCANFEYLENLKTESEHYCDLRKELGRLAHAEWTGIYPDTDVTYRALVNDLVRLLAIRELGVVLGARRIGKNVLVYMQIQLRQQGIHLGAGYRDCISRLFKCLRYGLEELAESLAQPTVS